MDANIILSPISIDALLEKLTSRVTAALESKQKADLAEKLLSVNELTELLNASKVTVHKWSKEGRLKEHRLGKRIYYKYSEVMDSMQTLKKYKKTA